jgi:L-fuconolactonase
MAVHHNSFSVRDENDDEDPFAHWDAVLALAQEPNVFVKVSCFPEVSREAYPFADIAPFFGSLYKRFGAVRLIWGSNYPPSGEVCSYKQSVDFVDELPFLSNIDKAEIFGGSFLKAVRRPVHH